MPQAMPEKKCRDSAPKRCCDIRDAVPVSLHLFCARRRNGYGVRNWAGRASSQRSLAVQPMPLR